MTARFWLHCWLGTFVDSPDCAPGVWTSVPAVALLLQVTRSAVWGGGSGTLQPALLLELGFSPQEAAHMQHYDRPH